MRITETCECGSSCTVDDIPDTSARVEAARMQVTAWRKEHRHPEPIFRGGKSGEEE